MNIKSKSTKKKMLVTGAAGMTGFHVPEVFSDYELTLTDIDTLDVRDFLKVRKTIRDILPDIVLHLAAETDVDKCETNPRYAFLNNAGGTQNVTIACNEIQALMVYFSTTNLFPGTSEKVYSEYDSPEPIHFYGRSKLAGEFSVHKFSKHHIIVRPGWMFGGFDKDKKFVGLMRKQIVRDKKKVIRGVEDRRGSATYAADCLEITRNLIEKEFYGTFHVVNSGYGTIFEMAQVIANHYGVKAESATSQDFNISARKTSSQMVENWMLEFYQLSNYVRDWRTAIEEYLSEWDKLDALE